MGGDTIKPEGTGSQIAAYAKYLPQYLQATGNNIGPFEQSLVNARGTIDPQNLSLDESLLKYYGPRFNEVGSQLQRQDALNQAGNELSVIQGPGGNLARAGVDLNKQADPEYYALRQQAQQKFSDLLGGQDPNRLTGAEMANVERGLNRTNTMNGNNDVHSSGGAIGNAMTFGNALDQKRNTLLNTLNAVPQNLASMKSGFDSFAVATGRPSYGQNVGTQQFQNGATGANGFGANAMTMGQGLLGEAGQNVRQNINLTANARDTLDRVNQTMGSLPSC